MKKVAFITGASRGIGAATARKLAMNGYDLALTARGKEELEGIASECEKLGACVLIFPADVRDQAAMLMALNQTTQNFKKVNVLFINHGMTIPDAKFVEDTQDNWSTLIDVNLKAAMYLTRIFLPKIIETSQKEPQSCALLYLSSVAGKTGFPQMAAYCASKFALCGFAQALFGEVQEYGIKVCTICPGWVNTAMARSVSDDYDYNKMIQPEEISQVIFELLTSGHSVCPTEIVLRPQFVP